MEIRKEQEGNQLTITLEGRLDTTTAPNLEAELKSSIAGIEELIFDFEKLEYISSAGQKVMNRQGSMVIRKVNENVMDVFEVTGFIDILTIE